MARQAKGKQVAVKLPEKVVRVFEIERGEFSGSKSEAVVEPRSPMNDKARVTKSLSVRANSVLENHSNLRIVASGSGLGKGDLELTKPDPQWSRFNSDKLRPAPTKLDFVDSKLVDDKNIETILKEDIGAEVESEKHQWQKAKEVKQAKRDSTVSTKQPEEVKDKQTEAVKDKQVDGAKLSKKVEQSIGSTSYGQNPVRNYRLWVEKEKQGGGTQVAIPHE
ncbi:OLC1v1016604C1 [Oldenlandia corymbosa var. corymbosa]|uniref:OLC1v1016604C1 n=1 Tax=Oldenlandia corymbosa var. corymbosa TaxID=529605 RepID=A0AAV1E5Z1_OLDCO|nr:OLC1v1016604C1 [Oldenlandia corymbosa var. corymbosa]